MRIAGCLGVFALALLFGGCAMLSSTYEITSSPSGATVEIDGVNAGVTPVSLTYSDPVNKAIVLQKSGYEDVTSRLTTLRTVRGALHFDLDPAAPVSFVSTMEPTWAALEIREGVDYETAWAATVDLLVRRFDLEVMSRDNGYIRTNWLNSWTGGLREDYRVRVTIKFSADHTRVDVKSEANFFTGNGWVLGSDTALLSTLKTDIMGTIGRTTR